jgi:hypothetical protein
MFNWSSVYSLASRVPKLLSDIEGREAPHYDWHVGVFQFTVGLLVASTGLTALQGASASLLSKVSPQRFRSLLINVGTIGTFVNLFARLSADLQIFAIDLSHKLINTDIVNCLLTPLVLGIFIAIYFVKKHFFFLM